MIIPLLGKSVSFTILMDRTTLKDEKGNHLVLLSNFFNSKQSSGLNESIYLYLLLSDLLLFRRKQGKRLFYFIVCHQMVIYHFDLIALITKDSVAGLFFFKGNFLCIPVGELGKIYKASDACIFNCSWVLPMVFFSCLQELYLFKYPLPLHYTETYSFQTLLRSFMLPKKKGDATCQPLN